MPGAGRRAYLESARALGLPVIFCGERPSDEAMRSYDKCWYVGGSPAKQGELLGEALFEAYLCGMIPDKNADKLVQVLTVTEGAGRDGRAEAALRIFENRGVYSEFLPALAVSPDLAENAVNLISAQLSQLPQTELVLAATPALARRRPRPPPGLPVACFGDDGGLADADPGSGAVLAAVSFDKAAAARTVAAFARNAADGKDPTDGTEARLDDARGTLVGFSVFSAPLPVAQAGERPRKTPLYRRGKMTKNEIIELEITALSSDGNGVGRADGMAVFVPFTAPGDRALVKIVKVQKSFAFGILHELLSPGPARVEPDCPVFGRCGGCALRQISYPAELAAKTAFVEDAFRRIGGFSISAAPCLPSPQMDRYRNKAQYPLGADAEGRVFAGFFAPRSHRVIPWCGLSFTAAGPGRGGESALRPLYGIPAPRLRRAAPYRSAASPLSAPRPGWGALGVHRGERPAPAP